MVERILYEFPHSHFCEKARWALDFKGLDFRRIPLLPGWHVLTTKRYGKYSSVPLLIDEGKPIQGSGKIMTYLDEVYSESVLTLGDKAECYKCEKDIDENIGVALRAFFYFYCLKYKDFVTSAFMQNSPRWQKIVFSLQYPFLARMIKQSYCPNEDAAIEAGKKLINGMDRLWNDLDGRPFLRQQGFSRLDITVCSLLSFIARPAEIPIVFPEIPKDVMIQEWDERLRSHPLIGWVQGIYRSHRQIQKI